MPEREPRANELSRINTNRRLPIAVPSMTETVNNQVEAKEISTALQVEQLDSNLFRSKSLWLPRRARGVFGGQVISQALVSATNCVDPAFGLHSLHCYFLLSASPAIPIIYHVDRVREGRSYVTRAVRAVQKGRTIFVMLCSFQKPEPRQPTYQWPMPKNVPSPNECDPIEAYYARLSQDPNIHPKVKEYCDEYVQDRTESPLHIRDAGTDISADGRKTYMYWYKVKNLSETNPSFQKCILSYISDSHFIGAAAKTLGMNRLRKQDSKRLGMLSTLDHSIWFYDDNFDCGDWILYVVSSSRIGSGRGVVHGRMYTPSGSLVAVLSQEGVLRADIKDQSKL
ncbi:C/M/P thioester hydrolase family protein [Abortiporus biennis]